VRSKGEDFRSGWVAEDIVSSVQKNGGILTMEDLAAHQPEQRPVVTGAYRGWTVWSMGPPSSGGVVLVQVLKALETYDLVALGHNSSSLLHLYAEFFQHAFADRAHFMGDPDRVDVPVEQLISKERVEAVKNVFNPNKTHPPEVYGAPYDAGQDAGTQHISVIDKNGNSIALTTTINTNFGSKVVGEKSGLILNNEMDDFVARPGQPNAYGLIGSHANAVAPGAVPLSSMSPTLLRSPDGTKLIAVGASGGPFIISSTLQVIVNLIDFEMDANEAVSVPRMHHQWQPQTLFLDVGIPKDIHFLLQAKGHRTEEKSFSSSVQVVMKDGEIFIGAQDPRKDEYR
jgi:gamma-glutamyltranspeptidase/glutathione hydrolase